MKFNLELLLVIAIAVTAIIWLLGKLLQRQPKEAWYVDMARAFFQVFLAVLVLRTFVAEPFQIPSGSMRPTLLVGDFILVNKFSYGLRLPVVHTKVMDTGTPGRGDVIVFRFPPDPSKNYIKRLIGLPGDRVEYRNKTLSINGQEITVQDIGNYESSTGSLEDLGAEIFEENLAGVKHAILLNPGRENRRGDGSFVVPDGHYFVMGDNRDNSNDSRYWLRASGSGYQSSNQINAQKWGFVPEENLVGKASLVWMNWDFRKNKAKLDRIGIKIK